MAKKIEACLLQNIAPLAIMLQGTTKNTPDNTIIYDGAYTTTNLIPVIDILSFAVYLDIVINKKLAEKSLDIEVISSVGTDRTSSNKYDSLFNLFTFDDIDNEKTYTLTFNASNLQIKKLIEAKIDAGQYSEHSQETLMKYDCLAIAPIDKSDYWDYLKSTYISIFNSNKWDEIKEIAIEYMRKSCNVKLGKINPDARFKEEEFNQIVFETLKHFEEMNTKSNLPKTDEDAHE